MPKPLETGVCCWRRWKADMGRVTNSTASHTTSFGSEPAAPGVARTAKSCCERRRSQLAVHRSTQPRNSFASAMLVPTLLWTNATNLTLRNHHSWAGAPLPNSFARLPLSAEAPVRSPVWSLSTDAAGVQVTFATDASSVAVRWRVGESSCPGEATVPIVLANTSPNGKISL